MFCFFHQEHFEIEPSDDKDTGPYSLKWVAILYTSETKILLIVHQKMNKMADPVFEVRRAVFELNGFHGKISGF